MAANESTAIGTFEHLCADVAQGDYLVPFVAPVVPAGADRDETPGEPDFTSMGQVVSGNENRSDMGTGDFVLIDRGSDQGMVPEAVWPCIGTSASPDCRSPHSARRS